MQNLVASSEVPWLALRAGFVDSFVACWVVDLLFANCVQFRFSLWRFGEAIGLGGSS